MITGSEGHLLFYTNVKHHLKFIKDRLSRFGNVPTSFVCSICLEQFAGATSSEIAHLSCYHYFHPIFLNTYIKNMEAEIDEEKREAQLNKIKWKERGNATARYHFTEKTNIINKYNQVSFFLFGRSSARGRHSKAE